MEQHYIDKNNSVRQFVTFQAGRKEKKVYMKYLFLNALLMANAIGLGFMGGELQYG